MDGYTIIDNLFFYQDTKCFSKPIIHIILIGISDVLQSIVNNVVIHSTKGFSLCKRKSSNYNETFFKNFYTERYQNDLLF